MPEKKIVNTAFQRAYLAWFSDYEKERRHGRRRKGAKIPGFPAPPTSPEEIAQVVDSLGKKHVIRALQIHRSTLARWLAGKSVIPRPTWLILVLMSEGRLPGMSEDWKQFRFDGDRLYLMGTRLSYSALEIAGWQYQQQHAAALARRVVDLEEKIRVLLRAGEFGAANDAVAL